MPVSHGEILGENRKIMTSCSDPVVFDVEMSAESVPIYCGCSHIACCRFDQQCVVKCGIGTAKAFVKVESTCELDELASGVLVAIDVAAKSSGTDVKQPVQALTSVQNDPIWSSNVLLVDCVVTSCCTPDIVDYQCSGQVVAEYVCKVDEERKCSDDVSPTYAGMSTGDGVDEEIVVDSVETQVECDLPVVGVVVESGRSSSEVDDVNEK